MLRSTGERQARYFLRLDMAAVSVAFPKRIAVRERPNAYEGTNVDLSAVEIWPGTRVEITDTKPLGGSVFLGSLQGTVIGPHSIAKNWFKIRVDPNNRTEHLEWPLPAQRLQVISGLAQAIS